jgi:perosamine synthetase
VRVLPHYGVDRDTLSELLRDRGIGTSVHFIPVHQLSWYRHECVFPRGGFPGADEVFERTLSLPLDQVISDDEVDEVCSALIEIGGRS